MGGQLMANPRQIRSADVEQMTDAPESLYPLIEGIYASAQNLDDYSTALEQAARCMGYQAVGLMTTRSMYSKPKCHAGWNIDVERWTQAEREFGVLANLTQRLGQPITAGDFAFRDEMITTEQLLGQPWYELLRDQPHHQDGMQICLESSAERHIFLVFRNPTPWPERPEDRSLRRRIATRLAPHWVRATQIHLQMHTVEMLRHAYAEAANIVPYAMVVFDNRGQIFLSNSRAQRQLVNDGLILDHKGLRASNNSQNRSLQEAIRKISTAELHDLEVMKPKDVIISRPSGKRAYQVIVKPLSPGRPHDGKHPAAAALVVDPDVALDVTIERCQALFGFTRAESLVAIGIMRGHSVRQIAAAQGNSITTVRNLLKRAFQKAGVGRQHELTRLLLSSPLVLDLDDQNPKTSCML